MAQAKGSLSHVVIDFETTFGADPGTKAAKKMPFNSCSVTGSQALNTAQTILNGRNPTMPFAGNKDVGGQIVVPVDLTAFPWWLKGIFGAPTTTGSGPYTHVYKVPTSQPSMVIEKKFDFGTSQTYIKSNGCKIGSLDIAFGGDGELTASLDIIGATEAAPSGTPYAASPTAVALNRLMNFQAAITEGGSAIATVTDLSIKLNCNLDTSSRCIGGDGVLADLPEGVVEVSGSLTALFDSTTLLTKAAGLTESSLTVTLTSATHSLKFEIPELLYSPKSPGIEGPMGIKQSYEFRGYYDNAAGASAMIVTLVNAVTSYA